MKTKYCRGCGRTKSIQCFNKKGFENGKRRIQARCKLCQRIEMGERYHNLTDDQKLQRSEYRKTYLASERGKHLNRAHGRKWRTENLEQYNQMISRYFKAHPERTRFSSACQTCKKRQCMPAWLTKDQKKEMFQFYKKAVEIQKTTGVKMHVDHIIPIHGKNVTGLHVPWNLQIIPAVENLKKGNKVK